MKKFISLPYIYPICPLNINHSRMFIVGDIIERYSRMKKEAVFFPVASHYSGNSAQNISETFKKFFLSNQTTEEEKKIFSLYKNIYNVPSIVLKTFTNPLNILNFFNQEILWELKSLNVSADYEYSYTTENKDFSIFINTIISLYEKNKLLIYNKNKELALNYDNSEWRRKTFNLLEKTEILQPFHKNNIISATKYLRSDWGLLRETGFGVRYNKKWVIDPMFDSELLSLFDLYIRFKAEYKNKSISTKNFFENLFEILKNPKRTNDALVSKIIEWLPCDIFICEEHLKIWLVKKIFAESLLLNEKYQTKKYFILGTGLLNGKRMSASRGNAILTSDLINKYGPTKARLIIILQGGHPSKTYEYNQSLSIEVDRLIANFTNYFTYLLSLANKKINIENAEDLPINTICDSIEKNINNGHYRQAVIELLSTVPQKYKIRTTKSARSLIFLFKRYLDILLPGLLEPFAKETGKFKL